MLNLKQIALFAGTLSLIAFSSITAANAQTPQPQSTSSEESFRKAAPQLPKPGRFVLPKTESFKLANGLEVLFVEDHRFPYVSTNLGFRTGSSDEPKGKSGIADMTAGLLTEGAADLNSKDLARAIEFIGGGLKADCDYDYTIVSGSCLSAYTDKLLDLFGKVVLKPTFPEEELNLQKVNLIQALNIKRSDPDFLIEERFNKVLFGNHPYSIVAPTEASINKINRNELIKYHQEHYLPNKAVLIVVGDFKPEAMKELLNKHLGESWKAHELNSQVLPEPPRQSGRHIYLVDRPGSVQTSLKVGNLAIKRNSPDFFPMMVANQILGGAAHARLFMNIREDKGFTYGAYSKLSARKALGSFYAQANVRTDVTNPSLLEFLYETEKLRSTRAKDEELDLAKNYLAGSFQLGLETQGGLAQRLLEVKLFDLPADYLETYADKVMAVSAEDVKKASTKLIDSNNMVICAVGDAKKIKADLEIFAPVAVFNPEGTLKSDSSSKSVN